MDPEIAQLEERVIELLKTVYDPELPVNVYELGLIYELKVDPERRVFVKMTLTAPNCPAAGFLPGEVERKIKELPGVENAEVKLVFDPPYHRDMMSEEAKLELGLL